MSKFSLLGKKKSVIKKYDLYLFIDKKFLSIQSYYPIFSIKHNFNNNIYVIIAFLVAFSLSYFSMVNQRNSNPDFEKLA